MKISCILFKLTCSQNDLHPKSSLLSHSNVSPRSGLKGFPVLLLVVAYEDAVNAATYASCSHESSHCAALSRHSLYSKSSVKRCRKDRGSPKFTYKKRLCHMLWQSIGKVKFWWKKMTRSSFACIMMIYNNSKWDIKWDINGKDNLAWFLYVTNTWYLQALVFSTILFQCSFS